MEKHEAKTDRTEGRKKQFYNSGKLQYPSLNNEESNQAKEDLE